jgi:hypothetical protein
MATRRLRLKVWLLHKVWYLTVRAPWPLSLLWLQHCHGRKPALCWIPAQPVGYYRGGILAQYCVRLRGHRGQCLARINRTGTRTPTYFTPEQEQAS